jgi:hypothetical protein
VNHYSAPTPPLDAAGLAGVVFLSPLNRRMQYLRPNMTWLEVFQTLLFWINRISLPPPDNEILTLPNWAYRP